MKKLLIILAFLILAPVTAQELGLGVNMLPAVRESSEPFAIEFYALNYAYWRHGVAKWTATYQNYTNPYFKIDYGVGINYIDNQYFKARAMLNFGALYHKKIYVNSFGIENELMARVHNYVGLMIVSRYTYEPSFQDWQFKTFIGLNFDFEPTNNTPNFY